MKKLLIVLAGMAAALAFCASSAKARPDVTTDSTPLNVSIVIITNGVEKTDNDVETGAVGKAKISNSTLLKIFAHWAEVDSWPAGAKLVIGWDWDGEVLVVDKTGTNVLFDADATPDNYFTVDFRDEEGAESYKSVDKDPGSLSYTDYDYGDFEFYDDEVYLPYTDLYGEGNTTVSFTQNWNAEDEDTTWSLTADMKNVQYAEGSDLDWLDEDYIQVGGSIRTSGGGKGANDYFLP